MNLAQRLWTELVEKDEHINLVEYPEKPRNLKYSEAVLAVDALINSHLFCIDNLTEDEIQERLAYDVHEFFLTLPPDLDIQEKRFKCYEKFPDVLQDTICRWINKWQPNDSAFKKRDRQKNREQGYELFRSLPHNLTIEEKRKFLREKMPHVNRRTIFDWTVKWQSELEATQQP